MIIKLQSGLMLSSWRIGLRSYCEKNDQYNRQCVTICTMRDDNDDVYVAFAPHINAYRRLYVELYSKHPPYFSNKNDITKLQKQVDEFLLKADRYIIFS